MSNPDDFMFNKQEWDEHRQSMAEYYAETEYVKASSRSARARELSLFKKYASKKCDNIVLHVDNRGGFCNRCQHYHFRFPYGIELLRRVQVFDAYQDIEILEVVHYFDPKEGIDKTYKAWRPLMVVVSEHWEGKYKVGQEIKCYWNPDEGMDCMSFGNQPAEGIINAGSHPSEWSTFPDTYGVDEKVAKRRRKEKTDYQKFVGSVFDKALANDDEEQEQKFPELFKLLNS